MVLASKQIQRTLRLLDTLDHVRYNGSSDLQLERMNVYFNEVERGPCP